MQNEEIYSERARQKEREIERAIEGKRVDRVQKHKYRDTAYLKNVYVKKS